MNLSLMKRIRQFKEAEPGISQPIYLRLRKMLEEMILGGELPDGYRLPRFWHWSANIRMNSR